MDESNNVRKFIVETIREYLGENINETLSFHEEFLGDLQNELSRFENPEAFLRAGGLSNELLNRLAFGFAENDITELHPEDLKIKWKDDLENVKWEITRSGLSPKMWAAKIDLSEPIEVSFSKNSRGKNGFYIEDGHHRYMAAKILKKPLNVLLTIKANPIIEINPNLGYDELHRLIFNKFKI